MAKRRLSHRQKNRIRDNQQSASKSNTGLTGLVIAHHGKKVKLELESNEVVDSQFRANLGSIVCGDRVSVELTEGNEYRIHSLRPRNNLLQRLDGYGKPRALAANITQMVVCLAVSPPPNLILLDQYLLTAEQMQIPVVILLNKCDLEQAKEQFDTIRQIYQPLGYAIIETCAISGKGLQDLQYSLDHNTSVITGVSGVGKSSITQWLVPDVEIRVSEISEANEEGRHTTRTSRLYHLQNGGHLIDTPGIRSFNPAPVPDVAIANGFREISARAVDCQFHNCRHINEPRCAVIAAVQTGDVAESRYQNYLKLMEQEQAR